MNTKSYFKYNLKHIINIFLFFLLTTVAIVAQDANLRITVGTDPAFPSSPQVTIENSLIKAVIRVNPGGLEGTEHAIRDFIVKSNGQDLVNYYIDACAQRPAMDKATIVYNGSDRKTVRCEYLSSSRTGIIEYTIYPNKPFIKIDYIRYDYGGWANIVERFNTGTHKIYGQSTYGPLVYYPDSYWNTYDVSEYPNHPKDGGALNYKGNFIVTKGETNGKVFGRTIPVYNNNVNGGARILKLLGDGYELFPSTGQTYRPAFTSYIFAGESGLDNAINIGKQIIDGTWQSSLPTITTHPSSQTVSAGNKATFSVSATGEGTLSYQWQKNRSNISGAISSNYTTPTLTISDKNST
jgi:hypothetical protein